MSMKRFSLKEYLANPSQKVVTRDGKPVRILCTDAKGDYPIVGLIYYPHGDEREVPENYTENGSCYIDNDESSSDLFFEPIKKEGWVNIYKDNINRAVGAVYTNKEEAEKNRTACHVATIKITWDE